MLSSRYLWSILVFTSQFTNGQEFASAQTLNDVCQAADNIPLAKTVAYEPTSMCYIYVALQFQSITKSVTFCEDISYQYNAACSMGQLTSPEMITDMINFGILSNDTKVFLALQQKGDGMNEMEPADGWLWTGNSAEVSATPPWAPGQPDNNGGAADQGVYAGAKGIVDENAVGYTYSITGVFCQCSVLLLNSNTGIVTPLASPSTPSTDTVSATPLADATTVSQAPATDGSCTISGIDPRSNISKDHSVIAPVDDCQEWCDAETEFLCTGYTWGGVGTSCILYGPMMAEPEIVLMSDSKWFFMDNACTLHAMDGVCSWPVLETNVSVTSVTSAELIATEAITANHCQSVCLLGLLQPQCRAYAYSSTPVQTAGANCYLFPSLSSADLAAFEPGHFTLYHSSCDQ